MTSHPTTPSSSTPRVRRVLLSFALASVLGCDVSASASAGTNAPEPPAKPEYERTYDEFSDVPNQMGVQVAWAAEPIDHAILLADEIAQLRTELNIDSETFASMCTVAFTDGTVEIGAVTEVEETRAQIEATLAKIKEVGAELKGVPARAQAAGKAIGQLAMATPKLLLKSTKELSGELAVAVGDGGVQIEADIQTAKALPATIKAEAAKAKDKLAELPAQAQQATSNLMAAIKGEPYEAMAPVGGAAEGEAEAEVDAGATTSAEGTAVATAEGTATATATGSGSASAPAGGSSTPPASKGGIATAPIAAESPTASLPPEAVKARINDVQRIARETSARGDWLTAADAFEEAYALAPENIGIAYKTGDAAAKAKDCARALVYLERFVQYADPMMFAPEIAISKQTIGELKTFECAPRTPEDEAARAETLRIQGEAFGLEGDWGGAAGNYAIAYQIDPDNHRLAFHVAVASWNSRECADASTYFAHFTNVGDPKTSRAQLREAAKYQERYAAGECPTWGVGERETLARDLYNQAQALELVLDFQVAIGKYERAYYLLPTNHALAFRIGESAWGAQLCDKAAENYRTFVTNVDPADSRFGADIQRANSILARVDGVGCPDALWSKPAASTTKTATSTTAGAGGGAGDENPPESGGGGGGGMATSSVACSVSPTPDRGPAGVLALALLGLAGWLRRRRGA